MPIPLIAIKDTYYDGPIKAGSRFSVRKADEAQLLKALGRATDPPPIPVRHERYQTRAESPEPLAQSVETADDSEEISKPRRTYRRRDLTAEEPCNSSD